jgi:hypothetical protein
MFPPNVRGAHLFGKHFSSRYNFVKEIGESVIGSLRSYTRLTSHPSSYD